jgi:hypothetical protein
MRLRMGFTNLHFSGTVVMDSLSKAIAIAQIEHSTANGNPDGHAQGGNYTGHSFPLFN